MAEMPPKPPSEPKVALTPNLNIQILAMLRAFSLILSARLLLLFAMIGAFTLAVMAEMKGGYLNLAVLVAFCVLTIIPLAVIDYLCRHKPRGE
jgi:hypothetical protein